MTAEATPPLADIPAILILVGTDVHPFGRLITWVDHWLTGQAEVPPVVVQYGHSDPPRVAPGTAFLDHDQLQRAMAAAPAVVCHGGPATITEARRAGHVPIVVPRDPAYGEHVDAHQLLFARRLASDRMIWLCGSELELTEALAKVVADPSAFRVDLDPAARLRKAEAVARVGAIVEDLVAARGPAKVHRRRGIGWRAAI